MLQLSGFECQLKQDQNGKYYEFTPKQSLRNDFLFCDLFIQQTFIRKHYQEISKQKLLFVCESEIPLWKVRDQSVSFILKIASQLLKAVYVCHQHKIPGRCFNINNILWKPEKEEIVLMEFGLAPQISISPPEYLDINSNCYGIEIDQFLIGSIIYYFVFQRPLTLNSNNLQQQEKQLQNELRQIQSQTVRKILQGLLNFNFQNRMKLFELGTILNVDNLDNKILEFYQVDNIDFKRTCTIIDQKIYFREAENPKFQINESMIFQTEQQNGSTMKKFLINKVLDVDFTKVIYNYQAMFQCFDDSISIVNEFNGELNFLIPIGLFALQQCKLYLQMQLRDELKNKNSKLFLKNPEEQSLWEICFNENHKKFFEISQQLEKKIITTKTTFSSSNESNKLKQVLAKIQESDIAFYQTNLNLNLRQIGYTLIAAKTLQEFMPCCRQAILLLWCLVEDNLDFTITTQKAFLLRISLFFCAFSEYFSKIQDINYIDLNQQLTKQQFNPENYISKLNLLQNKILNSPLSNDIQIFISKK